MFDGSLHRPAGWIPELAFVTVFSVGLRIRRAPPFAGSSGGGSCPSAAASSRSGLPPAPALARSLPPRSIAASSASGRRLAASSAPARGDARAAARFRPTDVLHPWCVLAAAPAPVHARSRTAQFRHARTGLFAPSRQPSRAVASTIASTARCASAVIQAGGGVRTAPGTGCTVRAGRSARARTLGVCAHTPPNRPAGRAVPACRSSQASTAGTTMRAISSLPKASLRRASTDSSAAPFATRAASSTTVQSRIRRPRHVRRRRPTGHPSPAGRTASRPVHVSRCTRNACAIRRPPLGFATPRWLRVSRRALVQSRAARPVPPETRRSDRWVRAWRTRPGVGARARARRWGRSAGAPARA